MAKTDDDKDFLVASIDIGTTYSGYAVGMKQELRENPTKIYCPFWVAMDAPFSYKTATAVLLDRDREFVAFGYKAEEQYAELAEENEHVDYYYFHRFKTTLYDQIRTSKKILNTAVPDIRGKELPAIEVFSHAIRFMKNHLLKNIEHNGTEKEDIFWILTIPAIWDNPGKQLMREAAEKAEIDGSKLTIADESEAASIWLKYLPVEKLHGSYEETSPFEEGSRYLLLDAGGEATDITVHEVKARGNLKELEKASWGDWSGTSVDKAFKKMLCDIVGGEGALEGYIQSYPWDYFELFCSFECKKQRPEFFSHRNRIPIYIPPTFTETFSDIEFRTNQSVYKNSLKWKNSKLLIDTNIFDGFFEPACEGIIEHVSEVLQLPMVRGIQFILMVGGFSESPALQNAIKKAFPNINVLIPENPFLAVLKGAVLLHDKEIYKKESFVGIESKCIESDDTILLQIIPHAQKSNQGDVKNAELSVSFFETKNKNSTRLEDNDSNYMGNVSVSVRDSTPHVNNEEFKVTVVHGGKGENVTMEVSTASGFKTDLKFNCE